MADESEAVVVHPEGEEYPENLGGAIHMNHERIRQLHIELSKRETDVHHAVEEHNLVRQLQIVDNLTAQKMSKADPNRPNRMQISPESLARIIALKDEIKLESQRGSELAKETEIVRSELDTCEHAIADTEQKVEIVRINTGFDGRGGKPFDALDNVYKRHQLELAELEQEQKTIKARTKGLTTRIEELTHEVETLRQVEDEMEQAKLHLEDVSAAHKAKQGDLEGLRRIVQRKEKMLAQTDAKDLMKDVRQHEGDKRVLHADLNKQSDLVRINQRAVWANDDRIRKMEARLAALGGFLEQIFQQQDEVGASQRPAEVPPDATEVSVELFDDAVNELVTARETLKARDAKLEELDAAVEVLERKVTILHLAQVSTTTTAAQEFDELDNERKRLEEHVFAIEQEFENEKQRLDAERQRWESIAEK